MRVKTMNFVGSTPISVRYWIKNMNNKQVIKYILIPLLLLFVIITIYTKIYWFNIESKSSIPYLIENENNKPKSCYGNDCYLINYDSLSVLCFPKEDSFKSFFACSENKECRLNVFIRENGLFIANDTNVSVIENSIFSYSKIMLKEGDYSGTECYVNPKYIVK